MASFASGDPDTVAALVAADFANEHTSALGSDCRGRDEYRQRLKGFFTEFADVVYEPVEILVEGDRAAAAYVMRATVDDKPVKIPGMMRLTVRDGRIERRTDYFDSLTFLRQTGRA